MPNYLGNGRWSVLNTENVGGGVSWNRLTGGNGNSQITTGAKIDSVTPGSGADARTGGGGFLRLIHVRAAAKRQRDEASGENDCQSFLGLHEGLLVPM